MEMASGAFGPALPSYWKALALYTVSAELSSQDGGEAHTAKGEVENPAWISGARTSDMADPLDEEELAGTKISLMVSHTFNCTQVYFLAVLLTCIS